MALTHDDLDVVYYELTQAFNAMEGDVELFTHRLLLLLVEEVGDRDRCTELIRQALVTQSLDELKAPGNGMASFADNRGVPLRVDAVRASPSVTNGSTPR